MKVTFAELKERLRGDVDEGVDRLDVMDDMAAPERPKKWRIHVNSTEKGYYADGGDIIARVFNTKRQAEMYAVKMMRKYCDRYETTDANSFFGTYRDGAYSLCCTVLPTYD